MTDQNSSLPELVNEIRHLTELELRAGAGPIHTGWWDCCGCSTMYHFENMYKRNLELDQWLNKQTRLIRPAMCLVVLNEIEYRSFGHVFERNKFRLIGDVVRNGPAGALLYTLCFYNRETEQERLAKMSPKSSIVGAK